eukprot:TRINITY_DN7213_c0_g1_i1.p1 TRINITY_DN7213_c0_g1~~TRINITY_DN7213_c0_g1_i1.p1  ORF type:complete len:566 (-),score=86.96 TRINITY_DN7213_c0_g1_i1:231-1928(-)
MQVIFCFFLFLHCWNSEEMKLPYLPLIDRKISSRVSLLDALEIQRELISFQGTIVQKKADPPFPSRIRRSCDDVFFRGGKSLEIRESGNGLTPPPQISTKSSERNQFIPKWEAGDIYHWKFEYRDAEFRKKVEPIQRMNPSLFPGDQTLSEDSEVCQHVICPDHGEPALLHCFVHGTPICVHCVNSTHCGHEFAPIDSASLILRKGLIEALSEARKIDEDIIGQARIFFEAMDNLIRSANNAAGQVNQYYDEMQGTLMGKREEDLKSIEASLNIGLKSLEEKVNELLPCAETLFEIDESLMKYLPSFKPSSQETAERSRSRSVGKSEPTISYDYDDSLSSSSGEELESCPYDDPAKAIQQILEATKRIGPLILTLKRQAEFTLGKVVSEFPLAIEYTAPQPQHEDIFRITPKTESTITILKYSEYHTSNFAPPYSTPSPSCSSFCTQPVPIPSSTARSPARKRQTSSDRRLARAKFSVLTRFGVIDELSTSSSDFPSSVASGSVPSVSCCSVRDDCAGYSPHDGSGSPPWCAVPCPVPCFPPPALPSCLHSPLIASRRDRSLQPF